MNLELPISFFTMLGCLSQSPWPVFGSPISSFCKCPLLAVAASSFAPTQQGLHAPWFDISSPTVSFISLKWISFLPLLQELSVIASNFPIWSDAFTQGLALTSQGSHDWSYSGVVPCSLLPLASLLLCPHCTFYTFLPRAGGPIPHHSRGPGATWLHRLQAGPVSRTSESSCVRRESGRPYLRGCAD